MSASKQECRCLTGPGSSSDTLALIWASECSAVWCSASLTSHAALPMHRPIALAPLTMGCAASTGAAGHASEPHQAQIQQQPQPQSQSAAAPAAAASSEQQPHAETNDDDAQLAAAEPPQPPPAPLAAAPAPPPVIVSSNPHQQQEGGPPGLPSPLASEYSQSQQEGRARPSAAVAVVDAAAPGEGAAVAAPASAVAPPAVAEIPKPAPRSIPTHEHALQFHAARYSGIFTCDGCKTVQEGECYGQLHNCSTAHAGDVSVASIAHSPLSPPLCALSACDPCEFDLCLVCLEKATPSVGELGSGPRDGSVLLVAHEHALREFKNRYPEHGGAFKCDLCQTHGAGSSWSCPKEDCFYDLHPQCMLVAQRRG